MSETNQDNKIKFDMKSTYDPYGLLIPSYMRSVNSILLAKQQVSKYTWEDQGEKLINADKIQLTPNERKIVKLLVLKGVPEEKRAELWMITSGAKLEMKNNPGYYHFLLYNYPTDVELPNDRQIDLDVKRTFPEDPAFREQKMLNKLRNVLLAYSRRNIAIGYVQGFNFIVGRLLKITQNEEEVFWIFTQIIEHILPLNFYSEMAGLMIDVDILLNILQFYFPQLIEFMEENYHLEYFKNIIFQWFISLFIQNFNFDSGLVLWDVLFIDKSIVLFKATIGLIKYVYNDLIKIDSLENLKNFLKDTFTNFTDISYLKYYILLRRFEFNLEIINKNRIMLEPSIIEHINKMNTNKSNKLKEKIKLITEECYEDWPICVYDSVSVYKVYDTFVYKEGRPFLIIDDYFDEKNTLKWTQYFSIGKKKKEKQKLNYDSALVERKIHVCDHSKRRLKKSVNNLSNILDQINDLDESVISSTGDKSLDYSTEKSYDQEDKDSSKNASSHENTKKYYKKLKKQAKFLSSVAYSEFVKKPKNQEKDYENFVSKVYNKYNKLSQAKSFCLKNLQMSGNKYYPGSNDISMDI